MQFQEGHCNYGIIYDNYIKLELTYMKLRK